MLVTSDHFQRRAVIVEHARLTAAYLALVERVLDKAAAGEEYLEDARALSALGEAVKIAIEIDREARSALAMPPAAKPPDDAFANPSLGHSSECTDARRGDDNEQAGHLCSGLSQPSAPRNCNPKEASLGAIRSSGEFVRKPASAVPVRPPDPARGWWRRHARQSLAATDRGG